MVSLFNIPGLLKRVATQAALERTLYRIAAFGIPMAIALVSVLAVLCGRPAYTDSGGQRLALRVAPAAAAIAQPETARRELAGLPLVPHYDTHLSEVPLWFSVTVAGHGGAPAVVEFPSRHAIELTCWDGASLHLLGRMTRALAAAPQAPSGRPGIQGGSALAPDKGGFTLALDGTTSSLLCRGRFAGPAHLTVVQWSVQDHAFSVRKYNRDSGLLDGGMLVLACFTLVMALVNRQPLYFLFSGWVLLSLRVGALSAGWDIGWLGHSVPGTLLLHVRALTLALYGASTLALFQALFSNELAQRHSAGMVVLVGQWLSFAVLAAALLLPYRLFLPVMWSVTVVYVPLMVLTIWNLRAVLGSTVSMVFGAAFALITLSSLAEVIGALFVHHALLPVLNGVTVTLGASLLAVLAVAEQMRVETNARIATQASFECAYEAMPVGLFTLDAGGVIEGANQALREMLDIALEERASFGECCGDDAWELLCEQLLQGEAQLDMCRNDRHYRVRATRVHGRIEGMLEDTTAKIQAAHQLHFFANNDLLTRSLNRHGLEGAFAVARAMLDEGRPLTIAQVNLDRFKSINEVFGHEAGDEVLRQTCERIGKMLAPGHHVGRISGDEFVIVMPDTPLAMASLICRSISERVQQAPYRVGAGVLSAYASIGAIEVVPGTGFETAIALARSACLQSRKVRSQGIVVYERDAAEIQARQVEIDLVTRLCSGDLSKVLTLGATRAGAMRGAEGGPVLQAQMSLRHPCQQGASARQIVAAARKCGHAGAVDRWLLDAALEWIDANAQVLGVGCLCVALTGAALNDANFVSDASAVIAGRPLAAPRLCLEISAQAAFADVANTRQFIARMRAAGAAVALSGVGGEHTVLRELAQLPVRMIKLDRTLVMARGAGTQQESLIAVLAALAARLGMHSVAEGAFDAAGQQRLAALGLDYVLIEGQTERDTANAWSTAWVA